MDLNLLNERQLQAVKETEGYVRVIAGAGTGKTRVLVSRYLYLVSQLGIDPDSILCMTFTRKARNEMVNRIRTVLGKDMSLDYILTYHSFGSMFLREEIQSLGYSHSFRIFDEYDTRKIINKIFENHDQKLDSVSLEEMRNYITKIKKKEEYIPRMMNHDYEDHILTKTRTLDDVMVDEYLLAQRRGRWLDFDDLILFTHYILKTFDSIRERWQDRFCYFEVDEAQDTSLVEYEILEMLSRKSGNVFLVGDPDQNIYEWRDSSNQILLDYDKNHPGCKTFLLVDNYRSTSNILEASNRLIANNQNRVKKDLFALKEKGEEVHFEGIDEERLVALRVASLIEQSIQRGEDYRDNAILFRCNFYSLMLENVLREKKIPYEVIGAPSFYEQSEMQDILALVKIVIEEDDKSLLRMINKPSRKFGKKKVEYLLSLQGNQPFLETLKRHRNDIEFVGTEISSFLDVIEDAMRNLDTQNAYKTLTRLVEDSEYSDYLFKLKNTSHYENMMEFLTLVHNETTGEKEITLREYYLTTLKKKEEEAIEKNNVPLLTIHASKGLEFRNVYIVGMDEPFFPHYKTLEERKESGLEEERRLLYVAMTRAMERLYLFSDTDEKKHSRFIGEIFSEYSHPEVRETRPKKEAKPKKERLRKQKNVPNLFKLFDSGK
jgi:DNA helicase II / ATP-dependent DNA helicase PcrA